jgi:type II secretory pathway component PulF
MGILIRSGLPILQVLDMAARSAGNVIIANEMEKIATSVKEGRGLAGPMELSGVFPPIVIQMVAIGEETGKIDELLESVADYFDREADYTIKNLAVLIEPIFVAVLGVMVLIMALAVFLPMWDISSLFNH